jgi:integrase/recombinase XerD
MYLTAKGMLLRFESFCKQNRLLQMREIRLIDINDYLMSLEMANKTKNNHLGELKRMFSRAVNEEVILSNPSEKIKPLKVVKEDIHRLLTPLDLQYIFKGAGEWKLYYEFLYHTGLRAGDVALLKYKNIDIKKKVIVSLVRKNRKIHEFPIAQVLLNSLDNNMAKESPLFPMLYSDNESKLSDNFAKPRKHMQMLLKTHGRPKATLHSFRHTFNQALTDIGLEIEDRRVLLAHASSETTKIYTHPNIEKATEFVNMIPVISS